MTLSSPQQTGSSLKNAFIMDDLKIDLLPNNLITVKPTVTIHKFIPAEINLAPFSFQILSDDGLNLMNVAVDAINLNGTGKQTLSPQISIELNSTIPSAVAVGQVAQKLSSLSSAIIAIGNVKFNGPAGEIDGLNRLFSIVRVRIPLDKVLFPKYAVKSSRFDVAPANAHLKAADEILAHSPEFDLDMKLSEGDISVTENGVSLLLNYDIVSYLALDTSIPFLSLRVGIDDIDAIRVDLKDLSIHKGSQSVSNSLDLIFSRDKQLPSKVESIVSNLRAGTLVDNNIIIQGLKFGPSEAESYILFDHLNAAIPGLSLPSIPRMIMGNTTDSTKPKSKFNFDFDQDTLKSMFNLETLDPKIGVLDISTAPSAIKLDVLASINNPSKYRLSVPFVGVGIDLDEEKLVTGDFSGLIVDRGFNSKVTLNIVASLENSVGIQEKLQSLVGEKISSGSFSTVPYMNGIIFGSTRQNAVEALSEFRIAIPLSGGPSIPISTIFPAANDLSVESFKPVISNIDISAMPQASLLLSLGLSITNPLPVTVDVPYFELQLLADSNRVVTVIIRGIKIVEGSNTPTIDIQCFFSNEDAVRLSVSKLVDNLMNGGGMAVTAGVGSLILGPTPEQAIHTFQKIQVTVDPNQLDKQGKFDIKSVIPWAESLTPKSFSPAITAIDVATVEEGLQFGAAFSINNPTPVSVKFGHTSLDIALQKTHFASATLSSLHLVQGQQQMSLNLDLVINRDNSLVGKINSLVQQVLEGGLLSLEIGGVEIGVSPQDSILTFKRLELPVSFKTDGIAIGEGGSAGLPKLSLDNIKKIMKIDLETVDDGISTGFTGVIFNPTPVALNIGYLSVEVYLREAGLLTKAVLDLHIARGEAQVSLKLDAVFGRGKELPHVVKSIYEDFSNKRDNKDVLIGGIRFGINQEHAFDTFGGIKVPITLPFSSAGIPSLPVPGEASKDLLKLESIDVSTIPVGFRAIIGGTLKETGFEANVKIGYFSVGAFLTGSRLFTVGVEDVNMSGSASHPMKLPVDILLAPEDPDARVKLAAVVNSLLSNDPLPEFQLAIGSIYFGSNAANSFDFMSLIEVDLKDDKTLNIDIHSLGNGLKLGTATGDGGFRLEKLDIATVDDGISFDFDAGLPLEKIAGLDISSLRVSIGFIGAELGLTKTKILTFNVHNAGINYANNVLSASASGLIVLTPEDPEAPRKVADLINPIIAGNLPSSVTIGISKFSIGVGSSSESKFGLFSDIAAEIPIDTSALPTGKKLDTDNKPIDKKAFGLSASTTNDGLLIMLKLNLPDLSLPQVKVTVGHLEVSGFVSASEEFYKVGSFKINDLAVSGGGAQQMAIPVELDIRHRDDSAPAAVAVIISSIVGRKYMGASEEPIGTLRASGLVFGNKPGNTFSLFGLVAFDITAEDVKKKLGGSESSVLSTVPNHPPYDLSIVGSFTENNSLEIQVKGKIENSQDFYPIDLSIDYLGVDTIMDMSSINTPKFAGINARDTKISLSKGEVTMNLEISFVNTAQIASAWGEFWKKSFTDEGAPFGIGNFRFGTSEQNSLDLFSSCKYGYDFSLLSTYKFNNVILIIFLMIELQNSLAKNPVELTASDTPQHSIIKSTKMKLDAEGVSGALGLDLSSLISDTINVDLNLGHFHLDLQRTNEDDEFQQVSIIVNMEEVVMTRKFEIPFAVKINTDTVLYQDILFYFADKFEGYPKYFDTSSFTNMTLGINPINPIKSFSKTYAPLAMPLVYAKKGMDVYIDRLLIGKFKKREIIILIFLGNGNDNSTGNGSPMDWIKESLKAEWFWRPSFTVLYPIKFDIKDDLNIAITNDHTEINIWYHDKPLIVARTGAINIQKGANEIKVGVSNIHKRTVAQLAYDYCWSKSMKDRNAVLSNIYFSAPSIFLTDTLEVPWIKDSLPGFKENFPKMFERLGIAEHGCFGGSSEDKDTREHLLKNLWQKVSRAVGINAGPTEDNSNS